MEESQVQERKIRVRVPVPKFLQGPVTRFLEWLNDDEPLNLDPRRLLPAPGQTSARDNGPQPLTVEERLAAAAGLLGVEFRRGSGQAAVRVVKPRGAWHPDYGLFDRDERGVAMLPPSFDLLRAWQSGSPWLALLTPGVRVSTDSFEAALTRSRGMINSDLHRQIIDETERWLLPDTRLSSVGSRILRTGLLWAPEPWASGSGMKVATVFADAEPVQVEDIGRVVWSSLTDSLPSSVEVSPTTHPQLMGAPNGVEFVDSHYRFGGFQPVTGIFNIVPRYDMLEALLDTECTLLWTLFNRDQTLWCNAFARATRDTVEGLRKFQADLAKFCSKVVPVPSWQVFGESLDWLFQSFVPGGPLPPDMNAFHVEPYEWFLRTLGSKIRTPTPGGDMPLGVTPIGGQPVLMDGSRFGCLWEGVSGSGKTTTALWSSWLTRTPFGVLVLLSSVPGESGPVWSRQMGGQCWELDHLVQAESEQHFRELVTQDEEYISREIGKLEAGWNQWQYPMGLPLVIRLNVQSENIPEGKRLCRYRYVEFVRKFMYLFSEAWGRFQRKHPNFWAAMCFDDVAGVLFERRDPVIGEMAVDVGQGVREDILWAVNHLRKQGFLNFSLTVHDFSEMKRFPEGAPGDFGYFIRLPTGVGHSRAYVYEPKQALYDDPQPDYGRRQGLLEVANCRLPTKILQVLARTTDRPEYFV